MVEDGVLEAVTIKTKNFLKHYPCRNLKLSSIKLIQSELDSTVFGIQMLITTPAEPIDHLVMFKKKDLKDPLLPKRCVELLRSRIPEIYSNVTVTDVSSVAEEVLKNFSERQLPDSFILEKLPYRQLQLRVNSRKFFIKLNIKSYQRVLSLFDLQKPWPVTITLQDLTKNLKRREVVTLLLYLSQDSF